LIEIWGVTPISSGARATLLTLHEEILNNRVYAATGEAVITGHGLRPGCGQPRPGRKPNAALTLEMEELKAAMDVGDWAGLGVRASGVDGNYNVAETSG